MWESSTTSAGSGFSPAPGTNDTKDYTPGPLTQTTWFRRTVTSGSFSNTSNVIAITVTSCMEPTGAKSTDNTLPDIGIETKVTGNDTTTYNPSDSEMIKVPDMTSDAPLFKRNTEITGILDESMINIYPVPSKGHFIAAIDFEGEIKIDIMVYNLSGAMVLKMQDVILKGRTEIKFDLVSSLAGIYYLKFMNGKIQVVKKIVLSR